MEIEIVISIHAPREGSDLPTIDSINLGEDISIHAPREGSDIRAAHTGLVSSLFLSTLPVRGATLRQHDG